MKKFIIIAIVFEIFISIIFVYINHKNHCNSFKNHAKHDAIFLKKVAEIDLKNNLITQLKDEFKNLIATHPCEFNGVSLSINNNLIFNYKSNSQSSYNFQIVEEIKLPNSNKAILKINFNYEHVISHIKSIIFYVLVFDILFIIFLFIIYLYYSKLKDTELKYEELVENSSSIILKINPNGEITFWNEFAEKFFGFKKDEIIGKNVIGTIVPETDKSGKDLKKMVEEIISQPEKYRYNINENIKKNGERVIISWTNKPIYDKNSNLKEILSVGLDITEKKKLEEQLIQAQKMESLGRLVGGIAHDFNNILTSIIGFTELSMEFSKDDKIKKYLNNVLENSKRAARLIEQLLAYSRKQIISPKQINLYEHLILLKTTLLNLIGEDIELKIIPLSKDIFINADKTQLDQIIINLVINARDAIYEKNSGEKKIIIELDKVYIDEDYSARYNEFPTGWYAKISISDTGIGISEDIIDKIFDPFFTTKGFANSSGLGLSTTYGIIKQNNGHINVYSEPGEGTTFNIYWPLLLEKTRHEEEEKEFSKILEGDETILIVEDEEKIREFLKTGLEKFGYKVILANNGKDALKIIAKRKEHIDVIISDIVMPEINGKVLYDKTMKINPGIKFIFISGYSENYVHKYGFLEIKNFIQKPFSIKELALKIREIYRKS